MPVVREAGRGWLDARVEVMSPRNKIYSDDYPNLVQITLVDLRVHRVLFWLSDTLLDPENPFR
jgi:hypothetical protein